MKIRPVRNREDIRYEKQRLLDHQKALESNLRNNLAHLRDSVSSLTVLKQVLQLFARK